MDNLEKLMSFVPEDKELLFVCVGTDRSTGDALGPLVGNKLKESGLLTFGTIDEPVHAQNLNETVKHIKTYYPDHFVIGIDACLGNFDHVGWVLIDNEPLRPGAGVKKSLPEVGNISITGVVNVSGFMEYFVLQNTRLSQVMKMADEIHNMIMTMIHKRDKMNEVAYAI